MATTLTVDFHEDPLLVIREDARGDLVPLRPLIKGMGLDWGSQLQRVKRDPILGPVVVMTTTTASPAGGKDGVCLPLDFVPGFLFRIDASRVAERCRPKVLDYQRECYRELARAVLKREPIRPAPAPEAPPAAPVIPPDRALRMVARAQAAFGAEVAQEVWLATGLIVTQGMRRAPAQGSLFTYTAERSGGQHG